MAAGTLALAPLALAQGLAVHTRSIAPGGWLAVLFLGSLGGALGFGLWGYALRRSTPSKVAVFLALNPITAIALGVVLWVPLQPSDGASGALRFATGSHRLGPRPVVDLHDGSPQRAGADLSFDPAAWPSFAPTYEAGDAVAFTPITFHASPAMRRTGERAAWSCIFLSPRARWSHANAPNHPLCKVVADGAPVTELPHA
jgi:ectoine hydroxylase-related dioxygenase (phytanoyl-CoA dioxygenase family)